MSDFRSFSKILLISLACTAFLSYPNLLFIAIDWSNVAEECRSSYINSTIIRFLLFWVFTLLLLLFNFRILSGKSVKQRILPNILFTLISFATYKVVTVLMFQGFDWRPIILNFQFVVMGMMGFFLGCTEYFHRIEKKSRQELQAMKIENLESRYTALSNQINPHFFFNSLNGISSLVRKKDDKVTICYIDHLSDIFRYILQSENRGLVTVENELEFAKSFCEVMQVRYAGKLDVTFDVPEEYMKRKIPVLALLPLIENITVHNRIDKDHKMTISIYINKNDELVVSNPIYPKQVNGETHGIGLKNLENRIKLLTDKELKVTKDDNKFVVAIPLG